MPRTSCSTGCGAKADSFAPAREARIGSMDSSKTTAISPPVWSRCIRPASTRGISRPPKPWQTARSEEHTSELQSRSDLVCRLLLEKKKKKKIKIQFLKKTQKII